MAKDLQKVHAGPSSPREVAAEALVTDDVVEEAMQALFEVGGRLIGATSGDWPPCADDLSRKAIRSWLVLYALYNVPSLEELPDEAYTFTPYDICQIRNGPDNTWQDYTTLRTEDEAALAVKVVDNSTTPEFRIVSDRKVILHLRSRT